MSEEIRMKKSEVELSREFTCEKCHETFDSEWSKEEALAEKQELFKDVPLEDCGVVCDDCFKDLGFGSEPKKTIEEAFDKAMEETRAPLIQLSLSGVEETPEIRKWLDEVAKVISKRWVDQVFKAMLVNNLVCGAPEENK